jgi:hypothetical protein
VRISPAVVVSKSLVLITLPVDLAVRLYAVNNLMLVSVQLVQSLIALLDLVTV